MLQGLTCVALGIWAQTHPQVVGNMLAIAKINLHVVYLLDIILEPLSPNVVSGQLNNTTVAVHFYDKETQEDKLADIITVIS